MMEEHVHLTSSMHSRDY